MEKMSMLQKLFIKYGEDGARNPSPRGCYEPVVPEALKAQVLATQNHTNHKDEQYRTLICFSLLLAHYGNHLLPI